MFFGTIYRVMPEHVNKIPSNYKKEPNPAIHTSPPLHIVSTKTFAYNLSVWYVSGSNTCFRYRCGHLKLWIRTCSEDVILDMAYLWCRYKRCSMRFAGRIDRGNRSDACCVNRVCRNTISSCGGLACCLWSFSCSSWCCSSISCHRLDRGNRSLDIMLASIHLR